VAVGKLEGTSCVSGADVGNSGCLVGGTVVGADVGNSLHRDTSHVPPKVEPVRSDLVELP